MEADKGFAKLIQQAHSANTVRSLKSLDLAQERGDAASARFLLEKGPHAVEYGGGGGATAANIQIILNVGDPQPVDLGKIYDADVPDG